MSGSLTFGGYTAASFGLKVGSVQVYGAAGNNVNALTVPGRMGLVPEHDEDPEVGNEIREYNAGLYMRNAADNAVALRLAQIRKWLLSVQDYTELRDSYEPGFFRRAFFYGDVTPTRKGAGQNFELPLRFSCDPKRYIDNVEPTILPAYTGGLTATITPPEAWAGLIVYPAKPLIKVEGYYENDAFDLLFTDITGTEERGKISFGEYIGELYFDCETLNATSRPYGGENMNEWVTDVSGDVNLNGLVDYLKRSVIGSKITIYPRWWVR